MAVDGRPVKEMPTDQAANLLQGREGTTVTLTLAAAGPGAAALTIRRQRVDVPSVDKVQMLDSREGIGYLRLTCFQKTTRRDLEAALWQLHRSGMRSLIIDLRGNPGGLLITAVEVAELFLDHGVIVSTRGRSAQEDFTYTAHGQARGRCRWWCSSTRTAPARRRSSPAPSATIIAARWSACGASARARCRASSRWSRPRPACG